VHLAGAKNGNSESDLFQELCLWYIHTRDADAASCQLLAEPPKHPAPRGTYRKKDSANLKAPSTPS
jgi:hypothetical protein